jgi:hypothetical protein
MYVETSPIEGTYEELVDAAEDLAGILNAKASNHLDLTPAVERWLIDQLEQVERSLATHLASRRAVVQGEGSWAA